MNIKRKIINCFIITNIFLMLTINCSMAGPEVGFKFKGWDKYNDTTQITITGKINNKEWKKDNKDNSRWFGELMTFDMKYKKQAYRFLGFLYEQNEKYFYREVKPLSSDKRNVSLFVYVKGFSSKPSQLNFSYKTSKCNGFYKFTEKNFKINGQHPTSITFGEPIGDSRGKHPVVILDFSPTTNAENTNSNRDGDASNQTIITITNDTNKEINNDFFNGQEDIGIELLNNNGTIVATSIWQFAYNNKHIRIKKNSVKKIRLITFFGNCEIEKSKDNNIKLSDFFKSIPIKFTNARFFSFYYKKNKKWILLYRKELISTPQKLYIYIPKTKATKWKLSVSNDRKIKEIESFPSKGYSISLDGSVSYTIQTEQEAVVTVLIKNKSGKGDILFSGTTDSNEGKLEIPSYLMPFKGKTIRIEKKGFICYENQLEEIFKKVKKIKLKRVEDTNKFNKIKICSDFFENKMSGKKEDVNIIIYNNKECSYSRKKELFKGKLTNLEYFPSSSKSYRLLYKGYYNFSCKNIVNNTIDILPSNKLIILHISLYAKNSNQLLNNRGKFYTDKNFNKNTHFPLKYNQRLKSYFYICPFPIKYFKVYYTLAPKTIYICYPGFKTKEVKLGPKPSQDILEKNIYLQKAEPEIVIVISGNSPSSKKYLYESINALSKLQGLKKVKLFVAEQGKLNSQSIEKLYDYQPSGARTDADINNEIEQAANMLSNKDKCIPSYLIYIAKIDKNRTIKGVKNLHIISPDDRPKSSPDDKPKSLKNINWHKAKDKIEIKSFIEKALKGEL